ncbi:protein PLASTID MOVEMENT IMPAIRED 1-like [Bidens hawaiensis]|uniref:protein PLASTID MOVEMENT IMPAIRED 1-like n=1 Tax=Bidens hawaiensis TaxID=980011 RepID=UPI00404A9FCB
MAATNPPDRRNSNTQLLEELEALSQTLSNTNTSSIPIPIPTTKNRRTNSLVLTRTSIPPIKTDDDATKINPKPRARRMSLSPWRSRTNEDQTSQKQQPAVSRDMFQDSSSSNNNTSTSEKKGGLWNWKPIRVLTHIGKQKLSCLLSVEVVTIQGLPASMNGLRLSVSVRKKETKDGAVQTMPSRVSQGAADFEETLFVRCHVYCTPAGNGNSRAKFEPRPFVIHAFAVDAQELDFGRHTVDLSQLIQESVEKNIEGTRIRQWDMSFNLSGKAKGGELVMKLGFQIMEKEGGAGIYNQVEGVVKSGKSKTFSPSFGRKQSKSSFSIPSPRIPTRTEAHATSQGEGNEDFQGIDDLNLDAPAPPQKPVQAPVKQSQAPPPVQKSEEEPELDLPDFEVVDKGVEVEDKDGTDGTHSEANSDKRSVTSEVVKEVVHDQVHLTRLSELDSIAHQIKALESLMREEKNDENDEENESQRLDEDEDKVTREFLQMLENEDGKEAAFNSRDVNTGSSVDGDDGDESKVYIPDLGKGLGCVIQTRNGGYLVSMNPFDNLVAKKDTPKLTMQISRPMVLASNESLTGTELFQQMAALGFEKLSSEILSLMPMEELVGKTAEQIAFEGIASAIISGRNKEGASSSAARAITVVKSMATGMTTGRSDRISSGIWNTNEDPVTGDEILAYSLQKIEEMAVEALKVQADLTQETAPFDVQPSNDSNHSPFANAVPLEDWIKDNTVGADNAEEHITIAVVIQMRDPLRQYEAVGGPLIALIHATSVEGEPNQEKKFKADSLNVGGLKLRSGGKKNDWDTEKQRLTAMQWLVAYGLGKAGKKGKRVLVKGPDLLWSISSRVMADMWLKSIRNPDVKFTA